MELDYEKLGFRCGLECHQQLEGKKLFCDCLTLNSDKEPDVKFQRRLNAVAGETGEIDIAAKHETSKERKFFYSSSTRYAFYRRRINIFRIMFCSRIRSSNSGNIKIFYDI